MKTRSNPAPNQRIFMAVLIVLALLAILIWFADPEHRQAGESRFGPEPAASSEKIPAPLP